MVGIGDSVRATYGAMNGTVHGIKGRYAIVRRDDTGTLCAIPIGCLRLDAGYTGRLQTYFNGQRVFVPGERQEGRVQDPDDPHMVTVILDSGRAVAVDRLQLYPLHEKG